MNKCGPGVYLATTEKGGLPKNETTSDSLKAHGLGRLLGPNGCQIQNLQALLHKLTNFQLHWYSIVGVVTISV